MGRPDALAGALGELPHFRTLPPDLILAVAATARPRELSEGQVLFREGDVAQAFFAVRAGGVKLYRTTPDGREQVVHNLRAPSTFAEAALLSFGRYPVHAAATETTTHLIEIGGPRFLELFRADDRLAPAMVSSLSTMLGSLVQRVEELSLVQAGSRLARWMLRQPASGDRQPVVEFPLQKRELAAHLAMTPETLSRLLRRWHDAGWIESERARVVLKEPDRLLAVADGAEG